MSNASTMAKPPFDPGFSDALAAVAVPGGLTREMIPMMRQKVTQMDTLEHALSLYPAMTHEETTIPGPYGSITLSIFRPANKLPGGNPGLYYIHGGGMIVGNRFLGMPSVVDWMKKYDFVCISVEYRLAPENPNPIPSDECYAGLEWVGENVLSLGINPNKLMICGASAGGGLAAGTALLARDRRGPRLCAQLLVYPMLDDRNVTISSQQYDDEGSWSKKSNIAAWRWYLGDDDGEPSIYAAPARATDLSGLPQAYIDVGSADVFRDENVAYATRLWEFGVQAELHVWPGCIHGFDEWVPEHLISKGAKEARTGWIGRVLGVEPKAL